MGPSWQSYECKTYRTSAQSMNGELKEGVQQQRFDIAVMLASNTLVLLPRLSQGCALSALATTFALHRGCSQGRHLASL